MTVLVCSSGLALNLNIFFRSAECEVEMWGQRKSYVGCAKVLNIFCLVLHIEYRLVRVALVAWIAILSTLSHCRRRHRVESQINYKLYDCVKRLPFSFWENSFCNVWTGLCRNTRTILNNKFPHTADIVFNDRFCSVSRTLYAKKKKEKEFKYNPKPMVMIANCECADCVSVVSSLFIDAIWINLFSSIKVDRRI